MQPRFLRSDTMVSRLFGRSCLLRDAIAVIAFISLIAFPTRAFAQNCTVGFTDQWIKNAGYVNSSDSKVYYTYNISSMSGPMVNAILTAIANWNSYSGWTDMVIVGSPGAGQDIRFEIDNDTGEPCAAFGDAGTAVKLTSQLEALANNGGADFQWAVLVMMHEIGHFFRLDDTHEDWSTIMGNALGATCAASKTAWENGSGPMSITTSVAENANNCVDDYRYDYGRPEIYAEPDDYPVWDYCPDFYWGTDYYWCYDGCEYWYTDYEYISFC
jgi:hypothetical protein